MKTIIINELISANSCEILEEVDPVILMEMRERINPPRQFSYANGDHERGNELNEKRMRKLNSNKLLDKNETTHKTDVNQN